jgi:WD40 repeat protein
MTLQVKKLHTLTGHRDSVYTLQHSDDPSIFFSAAGDGMVVKWNLNHPEEGELIARLPNSIYALHFHPGTGLLIAGHNYEGIHLLDWKNKQEVGSLLLTKAALFDIASVENRVLVATGDGQLIELNVLQRAITRSVRLSEKNIRCLAINISRGEIAVGASDHRIRILDLYDLSFKHEIPAHVNSVFTVQYTPDGQYLLSGSRDARLKAWDADNGYTLVTEVVAHLYAINHLDFSPDSKHFVTCSLDKSIKVWETETLRLLKVIDKARHAGHGTSVNRLLWTAHEGQLISASDDRTLSVWSIDV